MPNLSKGTAIVMPSEGYATQDYEQAKFVNNGGTVSVRTSLTSNNGTASTDVGTANPLPVTLASLIAGENLTSNVLGVILKPVADTTYSPSDFTCFGAASGTGVAVKASPGNVYSVHATNSGTSQRYLQLFDRTTAPANGGTPTASYPLSAGAGVTVPALQLGTEHFAPSKAFGTGIALAISSTNGTLGTAGITVAEHNIHLKYV